MCLLEGAQQKQTNKQTNKQKRTHSTHMYMYILDGCGQFHSQFHTLIEILTSVYWNNPETPNSTK